MSGLPTPESVLPHRPPFLFVDQVTALVPGLSASGLWRLTGDEWFFSGHFPGRPTLPGAASVLCAATVVSVVSSSSPHAANANDANTTAAAMERFFMGSPPGVRR